MNQSTIIRARINPEVKDEVQKILQSMGLSLSDAIRLFFHQIVLEQKIPFLLKAPNQETLRALQAPRKGELSVTCFDQLQKDWKNG